MIPGLLSIVASLVLIDRARKYPDDDELLYIIFLVGVLAVSGASYSILSPDSIVVWPYILLHGFAVSMTNLARYRHEKSWGRSFSYWRFVEHTMGAAQWLIIAYLILMSITGVIG